MDNFLSENNNKTNNFPNNKFAISSNIKIIICWKDLKYLNLKTNYVFSIISILIVSKISLFIFIYKYINKKVPEILYENMLKKRNIYYPPKKNYNK